MGVLTRFNKPNTVGLYDTVGGDDVLEVLVEDFYCRCLRMTTWRSSLPGRTSSV